MADYDYDDILRLFHAPHPSSNASDCALGSFAPVLLVPFGPSTFGVASYET